MPKACATIGEEETTRFRLECSQYIRSTSGAGQKVDPTQLKTSDLVEAAVSAKRRGWEPLYVPAGSKNPGRANWQRERLSEEEIRPAFSGGGNIGIVTG